MISQGRNRAGYLPIAGYGMIGDCRSSALIGADGSIDWLCLPRFDDPSIFARLLDARRGGYWQIRPVGAHRSVAQYRDRSNVLRTTFTTSTGVVSVIDFMPVDETRVTQHARPHDRPRVIRLVICLTGSVEMECVIEPAPDYARELGHFETSKGMFHGDSDGYHFCVQGTVPLNGRSTTFALDAGDSVAFGLRCSRSRHCGAKTISLLTANRRLRETQEYWWRWIDGCRYDGPYQDHVWRSALALKLMTYAPTGAIIAAPTTSLPEKIGSYHNYDYRFTWLRDAAFTLYAFFQLGFSDEATSFFSWMRRLDLVPGIHDVPNFYTLTGDAHAPEQILGHLEGYRRSAPVRIGNAAISQLQLDVYGEVLDAAYVYARFGGTVSRDLWTQLRVIVDLAAARWPEPDRSIWELRDGDHQYTYSKVMCWVAVDRGLRLAEHFGLPADHTAWRTARRRIHSAVTGEGYNARLRSFTQVLGGDELDASVLRMVQSRFLDASDPRLRNTVDAIATGLSDGGVLLRRFRRAAGDEGRRSREGAFIMCSFWLADAMARVSELEGAQQMFERVLALASPLGLYAEEADMVTGEMLGNFPQALSHLALVGAAVNIERARHRTLGKKGLHRGT